MWQIEWALEARGQPEAAALARRRFEAGGAAHQLREVTHDGQAKPRARVAGGGVVVDRTEVLQDLFAQPGLDAHAGVLDLEAQQQAPVTGLRLRMGTQGDFTRAGKTDRIGEIARQSLAQGLAVAAQQARQGWRDLKRKPEALAALVEALIRDLDEVTDSIDHHLAAGHLVLLDFGVDGVFYGNKGRLYAYSIVLRELGRDFEKVLADRRQIEAWTRMVDHLAAVARLKPWLVWSAAPDSSFLPNHLAAQGYATLRVRMQAAELLATLK